jgi:hypothetical protein
VTGQSNRIVLQISEEAFNLSTMSLLSQLLALQSAEIQKVVPVLTIPVGR